MQPINPTIKGRGTPLNPPNRFQPLSVELEADVEQLDPAEIPPPQTVYLKDTARSIITHNDSPDVGFEYSINAYRGCSHGCIYCYARPTHEYLGFSAGLDFETKIMVKEAAPQLLREAVSAPRYEPKVLSISGVTDCYQPVERKLELTRRCLQVLAEFRNPCGLITKNAMITRDIDVLREMAAWGGSVAILSVTTLDPHVQRLMEPRTSTPRRRLEAVEALAKAGVPVGIMIAPVVPGLTDHEMPQILKSAASAGAQFAGYVPLRLPFAVKDLFADWLGRHFPDRKDKVLNRVRELRGGKLNDSDFHTRMKGFGVWADQFETMFKVAKRKSGMEGGYPELSTGHFRKPAGPQMTLW
jgi:DNA repair photolyase